jgi:phage repressor protein C with HTH and peptisase S24 domain
MQVSQNQRITQLLSSLKKSSIKTEKEFGEIIGEDKKGISDLKHGRKKLRVEHIEAIKQAFPEINTTWLLSGEGSMYHGQEQDNLVTIPVTESSQRGIAYYNFEVSAGPIEMFHDDKEVAERIFIPGFNDCDMAINVWGDSMYPHYVAGDIILAKQIHDKSIILYGEAYLIITKELRVLKIIKKHEDPSKVILRSANDNYDDVDLERDKILNLYLVKGKVKRNAI